MYFLCGSQLSYTNPLPTSLSIFHPQGCKWKNIYVVKTPTTHASSIQPLVRFHTQEEEWRDEKHGESWTSAEEISPFLLKEEAEIYIWFVFSDHVCQQREDWCERTFN